MMRWWPFWRKYTPQPTTEARQAVAEAVQSGETTQQGLTHELERWPEVHRVAKSLRDAHTRNHFSEAIEKLMERRA